MPSGIVVKDVTHTFEASGGSVPAIEEVSLEVAEHEFVAIVGPSGCGKSTLLNIVSGLLTPTAGTVAVGGVPVRGVPRDVGYMPARDSLLPWRSCLDNVALPLEIRGEIGRAQRRERARELIEAVGLGGFERAFPSALSHGMRQRVAVARTFATQPSVLLMDEPFSALDAQTKITIQDLFLSIWEAQHQTVVLITHDVMEAVALADRVVVFSRRPGRIKSIHDIDLPRPRSVQQLIFEEPRFQQHLRDIWRDLDV